MGKPYRVLVLAGGGVFGVIPAALLASHFKDKSLLRDFDCFAGTSVGGILAMCYAKGMGAQDVLHAFKAMSAKAFPKMPWWWRWNPFRTKFSADGLESVLQEMLPMKLGELAAPVVVPTIDFENNKPKVYDTLLKDGDAHVAAWEAARATSSAPTYFPPFKRFIDGGLMANLPILETAAAIKHKLGIDYSDMEIFVLGTGAMPGGQRDMRKVRHWSRLHWVFPLIHFMVRSNEMRSTFIGAQMDFKKYKVFNPVTLESDWEIDRVDLVPIVESMAANYDRAFADVYKKFHKQ